MPTHPEENDNHIRFSLKTFPILPAQQMNEGMTAVMRTALSGSGMALSGLREPQRVSRSVPAPVCGLGRGGTPRYIIYAMPLSLSGWMLMALLLNDSAER